MKKSLLIAISASLTFVLFTSFSTGKAFGWAGRVSNSTNETYMVVKITDENKPTDKSPRGGLANTNADNTVEFKVVATSQYKDEEKRVKDKYEELLKEWRDLIKTDPQTPHPIRITIKKMKTGYKTQKIAQEYADKLKDELANQDVKKGPAKQ
jgi:hypothetical protein